jgi:hypothetical protein
MNQVTETILVGFSVDPKKDIPVLIVGKKRKNQSMEVINAFQGDEAKELWNKLVVKNDI